MIGIRSIRTLVLGMILNVPITLGTNPMYASDMVYATFQVLYTPGYHIILECLLLTTLYALIDISSVNLTIVTPSGHAKVIFTLPSYKVKKTPMYQKTATYVAHLQPTPNPFKSPIPSTTSATIAYSSL